MLVVSPRVLATEVTTETSETTRNTIEGRGGARSLSRLRESASQHLQCFILVFLVVSSIYRINILLINILFRPL